jgi:hypothetical protein
MDDHDLHSHHHQHFASSGHSRAQSTLETQLSVLVVGLFVAVSLVPRLLSHIASRRRRSTLLQQQCAEVQAGQAMFDTAPRSNPVVPVKEEPEEIPDRTVGYLGEYNPYIQSEQALYRSPQFWEHLRYTPPSPAGMPSVTVPVPAPCSSRQTLLPRAACRIVLVSGRTSGSFTPVTPQLRFWKG